ncbi:MAG: hypothetical protein DI565_09560 [Ancylobacter novellus]|uniref:Uncharacterized protein n=1 Tax=Ancylobacter novellus TaxID=921 RepID=A0A2W5M8D8_ANCNO|nr:MAG: hypothetical protein DI565_09560 [Ancylobacter novellus]
MTDIAHAPDLVKERDRKAALWEFRALVIATYPLFLAAEIARRAAGGRSAGGRSVFSQAHATAAATLACAFMG